MGCRRPVTVVFFLPPSKIVTTNYLIDLFFFNFFHFFFKFWPQKLFVKIRLRKIKISEGEFLFFYVKIKKHQHVFPHLSSTFFFIFNFFRYLMKHFPFLIFGKNNCPNT